MPTRQVSSQILLNSGGSSSDYEMKGYWYFILEKYGIVTCKFYMNFLIMKGIYIVVFYIRNSVKFNRENNKYLSYIGK